MPPSRPYKKKEKNKLKQHVFLNTNMAATFPDTIPQDEKK